MAHQNDLFSQEVEVSTPAVSLRTRGLVGLYGQVVRFEPKDGVSWDYRGILLGSDAMTYTVFDCDGDECVIPRSDFLGVEVLDEEPSAIRLEAKQHQPVRA